MTDTPFSNRELKLMFKDYDEKLDLIIAQTTKHNGRLLKLERYLIIVGSVVLTLLFVNGSQFLGFIMAII